MCYVCKDRYSCPRVLSCFHTFCEKCLVSTWSKDVDAELHMPRSAKCPLCSDDVLAPNLKITWNEWVRSFPRNVLLESLMSTEEVGSKCDPCLRATEEKDAAYFCQDCTENLCEMCYSYAHQRMIGSSKHTVSKNAVCKEKLDMSVNCVVHANENVEGFCASHQLLCCRICVATEHKMCSKVLSVDETVQSKLAETSTEAVLSKLRSVVENTDDALVSSKKEIEDQEKKHVDFSNTASTTFDKIISKIRDMHDVFKEKLQKTKAKELERLQAARNQLEAFLYTLVEAEKLVTVVSDRGTPRQLFVTACKVKRQLQAQFERLEKMYGKQLEFDVQINEDLQDFSKLTFVAKLNEKTVDLSNILELGDQLKSFEDRIRCDDILPKSDVDPVKLVAKEIAEYSEEMQVILDGCLLKDGTVLTVGYREVRSFRDGEMRILLEIDGDDYVFNKICPGEENRIFICTNNNKIMEFSFKEDDLQNIRNIQVEFDFEAFLYYGGKFYCRSHQHGFEYSIAILDQHGKLLRLHEGIAYSGNDLALSMDGQQLYFNTSSDVYCRRLADWSTHYDYKISTDDENLSYISIDTDKYGNVYAVPVNDKLVYQISESGEPMSESGESFREFLVTPEDYCPVAISFDPSRQRFAVFFNNAYYNHNESLVKVYDLCVAEDEDEETV